MRPKGHPWQRRYKLTKLLIHTPWGTEMLLLVDIILGYTYTTKTKTWRMRQKTISLRVVYKSTRSKISGFREARSPPFGFWNSVPEPSAAAHTHNSLIFEIIKNIETGANLPRRSLRAPTPAIFWEECSRAAGGSLYPQLAHFSILIIGVEKPRHPFGICSCTTRSQFQQRRYANFRPAMILVLSWSPLLRNSNYHFLEKTYIFFQN